MDKKNLDEILKNFGEETRDIIGKDDDTPLTRNEADQLIKQVYYVFDAIIDAIQKEH